VWKKFLSRCNFLLRQKFCPQKAHSLKVPVLAWFAENPLKQPVFEHSAWKRTTWKHQWKWPFLGVKLSLFGESKVGWNPYMQKHQWKWPFLSFLARQRRIISSRKPEMLKKANENAYLRVDIRPIMRLWRKSQWKRTYLRVEQALQNFYDVRHKWTTTLPQLVQRIERKRKHCERERKGNVTCHTLPETWMQFYQASIERNEHVILVSDSIYENFQRTILIWYQIEHWKNFQSKANVMANGRKNFWR
jgi:hypothetical protein